ncbi:MAG TPA: hypothetical protein VMT81_02215, partial [Candidatus Paceibacterota bacterium]|nr:hypothetical protein [Candidatus Paceibacterota bacterium]
FTFDNQDSEPVTITGLTIDASFNGLNTSTRPLLLRFEDPATGSSLYDYHMETLPGGSAAGVSIPLSFTIAPGIQKMLPVQALGVNILQVDGTSPAIIVTLRGVNVGAGSGVSVRMATPQINWSCTVPVGGYNPYATSSPFLTGQACGS